MNRSIEIKKPTDWMRERYPAFKDVTLIIQFIDQSGVAAFNDFDSLKNPYMVIRSWIIDGIITM